MRHLVKKVGIDVNIADPKLELSVDVWKWLTASQLFYGHEFASCCRKRKHLGGAMVMEDEVEPAPDALPQVAAIWS